MKGARVFRLFTCFIEGFTITRVGDLPEGATLVRLDICIAVVAVGFIRFEHIDNATWDGEKNSLFRNRFTRHVHGSILFAFRIRRVQRDRVLGLIVDALDDVSRRQWNRVSHLLSRKHGFSFLNSHLASRRPIWTRIVRVMGD